MFSDLSYNAHQMTFKLSESKLNYLIQKSNHSFGITSTRSGIVITSLIPPVANTKFYSQMSKMYLPFNQKKLIRLQIAHCCLNQHLFRINCHDTGLCSKCKVPETVPHFLFVCPNYSTDRNVLKSAVEKLGLNFDLKSILSNKVVYPHLIHYICSSNRFI